MAVVAFLIAHGLVHLAVWATPQDPAKPAPMDPSRSWALAAGHVGPASMRGTSVSISIAVAAAYSVAGWAVALGLAASAPLVAAAAVAGLVFKALWFNRWLVFGVALDLAVLVALTVGWPASL